MTICESKNMSRVQALGSLGYSEVVAREIVGLAVQSRIVQRSISTDGSRKYVIAFSDGQCVETVAMPSSDTDDFGNPLRFSICFSTQAGCPMGCKFCSTGKQGFARSLTVGEIMAQLAEAVVDACCRVTCISAMGQGEPFLNYRNVVDALALASGPDCFDVPASSVEISTCGVLPMIERFSQEQLPYTLEVSLHSAIQVTRDALMPRCKDAKLPQLRDALDAVASSNKVIIEYLLLDGLNDDRTHLDALKDYCLGSNFEIRLLPYNDAVGGKYRSSSRVIMERWEAELHNAGLKASIRKPRGVDVGGGCGQLKATMRI